MAKNEDLGEFFTGIKKMLNNLDKGGLSDGTKDEQNYFGVGQYG
jgi:hypothetical protein